MTPQEIESAVKAATAPIGAAVEVAWHGIERHRAELDRQLDGARASMAALFAPVATCRLDLPGDV